ncbi:PREDICTED: twinfilin-1-like isoform X2 [Priapulus caudatus]|uniref:Twinfilin-1-like isoform X2 n=1 Tax=Priapulus caudatus TaxID=37621 RepID=A0ABM1EKG6_PRICU|nr:PREDICTED: twinfilin-1-like isoform X2 [Priapulus caudatus]
MSHQTGITASEELRKLFLKAREGKIRSIKISIFDEKLTSDATEKVHSSWDKDYDVTVLPHLVDAQPCYVLYRLDSRNENGYQWLFLAYSPDESPVREKMLYAATRATVKTEFGLVHIKDEMFGTSKREMSFAGYERHLHARAGPGPMTDTEEELARLKLEEMAYHPVDTRHETLKGVAFPISREALDSMVDLREGRINYIQLSIDLQRETINLEKAANVPQPEFGREVPEDHARYHLLNFRHTHEGDFLDSIVFLYSMPGYTCPIKERMLYSSCKAPLLDTIEQYVQLPLARKVEVDSPSEVTEEFLYNEIHPKEHAHKMAFAKPKGPPNRGARRITKNSKCLTS